MVIAVTVIHTYNAICRLALAVQLHCLFSIWVLVRCDTFASRQNKKMDFAQGNDDFHSRWGLFSLFNTMNHIMPFLIFFHMWDGWAQPASPWWLAIGHRYFLTHYVIFIVLRVLFSIMPTGVVLPRNLTNRRCCYTNVLQVGVLLVTETFQDLNGFRSFVSDSFTYKLGFHLKCILILVEFDICTSTPSIRSVLPDSMRLSKRKIFFNRILVAWTISISYLPH